MRVIIQDERRSAEDPAELEEEIADTLSNDAVLYDLPLADPLSCLFARTLTADPEVVFAAVVLDNGLKYDLLVVFRWVGVLSKPTVYSLGGIAASNQTLTQDEVAEILLQQASELFREFALDWKEAQEAQ
jgi:hypothetical protein